MYTRAADDGDLSDQQGTAVRGAEEGLQRDSIDLGPGRSGIDVPRN